MRVFSFTMERGKDCPFFYYYFQIVRLVRQLLFNFTYCIRFFVLIHLCCKALVYMNRKEEEEEKEKEKEKNEKVPFHGRA